MHGYEGATEQGRKRVSDGELESNTATVNVTVSEVNDSPTADAGPDQTVNAGDYVLELTVNDGRGGTDSDQVTISANGKR